MPIFHCAQVDRKTLNTITEQVMQLTARDLMSLWRLYVKVSFPLLFSTNVYGRDSSLKGLQTPFSMPDENMLDAMYTRGNVHTRGCSFIDVMSKTLNPVFYHAVNAATQGLTRLIKGGYKEGKTPAPEAVAQLLTQYSKTQESLQR